MNTNLSNLFLSINLKFIKKFFIKIFGYFNILKLNKLKNEYFIYTNLIYIYIIYNSKINLVI